MIDFSRFRLGSGKNTRQFHGLIAVFSCRSRYNGLLSVIIVTALEWNQLWLGDQVIQLIKNKCVRHLKKHLQLKSFSGQFSLFLFFASNHGNHVSQTLTLFWRRFISIVGLLFTATDGRDREFEHFLHTFITQR